MSTDAQEKYLNPWIEISGAAWQGGELAACPPPPRRHNRADREQIERFFAQTRNSAASVCLMLFDSAELRLALWGDMLAPRRGAPALFHQGDRGVVVLARMDTVKSTRKMPIVQDFRSDMRVIAYFRVGADGISLRHAEFGKKHVFATDTNGSLVQRSRLGRLDPWFDEFARRRHGSDRDLGPIDMENKAALVHAGISESLAIGIVRLSLTDRILDLIGTEVTLNQAADIYLTHIHRAATTVGVAPCDLALTSTQVLDVHRLIARGEVTGDQVVTLIRLMLDDPDAPARVLAQDAGLITVAAGAEQLHAATMRAVESLGLPGGLGSLTPKNRRKIRDQILGMIRKDLPSANMRAAAASVDKALSDAGESTNSAN